MPGTTKVAMPRTVAEIERTRFDVGPFLPDELRFLLRGIDALYAQGLADDDEYGIHEMLVDELRWQGDSEVLYCVDERWLMDRKTGAQIDPPPQEAT